MTQSFGNKKGLLKYAGDGVTSKYLNHDKCPSVNLNNEWNMRFDKEPCKCRIFSVQLQQIHIMRVLWYV